MRNSAGTAAINQEEKGKSFDRQVKPDFLPPRGGGPGWDGQSPQMSSFRRKVFKQILSLVWVPTPPSSSPCDAKRVSVALAHSRGTRLRKCERRPGKGGAGDLAKTARSRSSGNCHAMQLGGSRDGCFRKAV